MALTDQSKFPRVLIIGGGFGGMQVAMGLANAPVEVLMLDKHNYHVFQPLLYQVATGSLEAEAIAFSLRKNFDGQKNFTFRIAEVNNIDTTQNKVSTNIGDFDYDYLVIATGSTTNFFGNKEIEHYAMPMKSIPEALNLRYLLLQNIEEATRAKTAEDRAPYLNFVLVGAGPTGVELAGALAELKNHVLCKDYPELKKEEMHVYLVDFLPKVLGPFSESSSKGAERFLKDMGVEVLLGVKVNSYDGNVIKFEGGQEIATKNVIWSAGVMGVIPDGISKDIIERGNKIKVDETCLVNGTTNVYAIGDVASMITTEYPKGHPGVAQVAIQMGKHVAKTIRNIIDSKPTNSFKYFDKGSLATIGRNKAVADIWKIHTQGFIAWMIWWFVHIAFLLGFRNKVSVFLNWIFNYISNNGGSRLILTSYVRETQEVDQEAKEPKADNS
ncbi:NAD(P)/FAD-dependent oxidoreductase [Mucilaginibacter ginkgonis]|uniref:NADH:ubiquinone reductase (non-electrogenic) n=1 Tax=Mucilaginibacter ginkgonis TaxID=2682091 RepID=A0A6I4I2C1_9SPHI|nr:NAD(P)/FAD-dependent oxidoreductase [Mucilaginibacter ginkgonis]QQL50695.1 NAD(P)/FAD-dependent oxidoreductase [Mucilaginibacter ginkgonis]